MSECGRMQERDKEGVRAQCLGGANKEGNRISMYNPIRRLLTIGFNFVFRIHIIFLSPLLHLIHE